MGLSLQGVAWLVRYSFLIFFESIIMSLWSFFPSVAVWISREWAIPDSLLLRCARPRGWAVHCHWRYGRPSECQRGVGEWPAAWYVVSPGGHVISHDPLVTTYTYVHVYNVGEGIYRSLVQEPVCLPWWKHTTWDDWFCLQLVQWGGSPRYIHMHMHMHIVFSRW